MARKRPYIYISCRGLGLHCLEMRSELQTKMRFKLMPDKTVMSVIDKEVISYCPFCGMFINKR